MGKITVHGGKHANRKISFREDAGIRPTGSRVRKTLFNWLRPHIVGARCLDLFSGSGILAFEAMSQGAASVLCVDHSPQNCQMIQDEASRIKERHISTKCLSLPNSLEDQFDMCFIDPPFDQPTLIHSTISCLGSALKVGAYLYIETNMQLEVIQGYVALKNKKVGNVWMYLWIKEEDNE